LRSFVPSDAYYSCAYYESPEAEMDKKGWLGADLIFDIDADHILTPCNKSHDRWICVNCGFAGCGLPPQKCPSCGMQKFEEKTWPCEICLESAKNETIKLVEMLTEDFGFSSKEVKVFFSGHRGYHVHVESEHVQNLDAVARKEIVDYIIGLGLDINFHGFNISRKGRFSSGPSLEDAGWRGRIAKGTYDFLLKASVNDLKRLGLKKRTIEAIISQKDYVLENWGRRNLWALIKGVGGESWRKIANYGAKSQASKIDTVVTTDVHRLIRLNGSLHGKTGFRKVEIPTNNIEGFDPLKDAVAFRKGELEIIVFDAPEIRVGEEIYGPFKKCRVELPTAVAMLLLCKGVAEVAEQCIGSFMKLGNARKKA
jgi:DNA primase small subunit